MKSILGFYGLNQSAMHNDLGWFNFDPFLNRVIYIEVLCFEMHY